MCIRDRFKHDRVRIVVEVPDDEIVVPPDLNNLPSELLAQAQAMLSTFEAIRNAPLPPDDTLSGLTAKELERIDAFELRAQIRQQQGRPV